MATSCSCGTCPSCIQSCENGPVDTIKAGKYTRVSDRNGNPKNLKNKNASILTSDEEEGVRNSDGSSGFPIQLNPQELSQAASVSVFTTEGVMGKMTPESDDTEDQEDLQFGRFDGVLQFKSTAGDPIKIDSARLTEVPSGFLATFVCSEYNKVELAKLVFDCEGTRNLIIIDGKVQCDTKEIDDCPDTAAVDELDSIWGCIDGKWAPINAQEGRRLIGNADGKWELEAANISGFAVPRYFIGQLRAGYTGTPSVAGIVDTPGTSGAASGTFNMTVIPNYTQGAKIVHLRCTTAVENITGANEAKAQIKANGEVIAENWLDTTFQNAYKDSSIYPVALVNDAFTFELIAYAATSTVWAWSKLEVVRWE